MKTLVLVYWKVEYPPIGIENHPEGQNYPPEEIFDVASLVRNEF